MSILNSTRPALLCALALAFSFASAAQVSPKVRERLLKNARPGLRQTCSGWSGAVRESWLEVESAGGLNCVRSGRLPEPAERLVKDEFIRVCVEDLVGRLAAEIDRHPKALTDYDLPNVSGEDMLGMYARSLYPSYQRFCADGPSPAIAPVEATQKGEISL